MAEYIDKRAAIADLNETYDKMSGFHVQFYNGYQTAVNRLRVFPAAEVEPVRHGRWEQCFEDWRKQIEGDKCSVCGFEHYGCSIRNYRYCPNCGARIDGGTENG